MRRKAPTLFQLMRAPASAYGVVYAAEWRNIPVAVKVAARRAGTRRVDGP